MAVILLNPDETFPTADGRTIGPLRCTPSAAFEVSRGHMAMVELVNAEFATPEDAIGACVDIMQNVMFELGIDLSVEDVNG